MRITGLNFGVEPTLLPILPILMWEELDEVLFCTILEVEVNATNYDLINFVIFKPKKYLYTFMSGKVPTNESLI